MDPETQEKLEEYVGHLRAGNYDGPEVAADALCDFFPSLNREGKVPPAPAYPAYFGEDRVADLAKARELKALDDEEEDDET